MAGYIIYEDGSEVCFRGRFMCGVDRKPHKVVQVQADGHELDHILNHLPTILQSDKRVQSWFGDDAKKIVADLLL